MKINGLKIPKYLIDRSVSEFINKHGKLNTRNCSDLYSLYYIVNKINNKAYIGITKDYQRRVSEHKSNHYLNKYKNKLTLYRAIDKYGIDNFIFMEIIKGLSYREAIEREITLISFFSKYIDLYNMTDGGDGVIADYETRKISNFGKKNEFKNVYCKNIYTQEIKIFDSRKKASDELNVHRRDIIRICRNERKIVKGWIFSDISIEDLENKYNENKPKKIMIRKYGDENFEVFESQSDLLKSKNFEISSGYLSQVLNGKKKSSKYEIKYM